MNLQFLFNWRIFFRTLGLQERVDSFISHLDRELDFVMITERMDESLVLLKEYLGWEMSDMLYLNRMVSSRKKEEVSQETQNRILDYQIIDRQLYDYFNKTFQRHVDGIGKDKMRDLLLEFQTLRTEFEEKCFDKTKEVKLGPYGSASWALTDYGNYENKACTFLQARDVEITSVMTDLQISNDYENTSSCKNAGQCLMQSTVKKIQTDYDHNRII